MNNTIKSVNITTLFVQVILSREYPPKRVSESLSAATAGTQHSFITAINSVIHTYLISTYTKMRSTK